jgi:hypothetical protein
MMTAASGQATSTTTIANAVPPARDAAAGWAAVRPFLWQFGGILATASSLAFVLWCFVPYSTPSYNLRFVLDNSWIQTLHVAFERRWQFGRDIVFTFGPWGFLCGGYYPPTFLTSVIAWSALALVFWLGCWRVAIHSFRRRLSAWLWMIAFVGVIGLPNGQSVVIDVRQVAWVLILLSLHFFVDDRPFSIPKILLTISLGWLGLIKFTGMMMASVVVLAIGGDEILRHRRFPWIVLIFIASVLGFWLLAGQELSLLPQYLANSWQESAGYTQAMIYTDGDEFMVVTGFLLVAVTVSAPFVYAGLARHRFWGIPALAGLGMIGLIVFKHGFVLCDHFHEIVAAFSVMLIALISLAVSWPMLQRHGARAVLIELLFLDVAALYTAFSFSTCVPGKSLFFRFTESFHPTRLLVPGSLLSGPDDMHAAYQRYLAQIRKKFPLPQLNGDVDVYPWQQDVVFAYGLPYHPRPVIQSYLAYTPKLAGVNAAYIRDGQSAENILFRVETLNEQYPSLEDASSWPELLTRYDVNRVTGGFVLLKRAAAPRAYHLVPVKEASIRFGERMDLPPATAAPLWAEIKIDKTFMGTMACLLHKPPNLYLTVYLPGGQHLAYGLVPGMARNGFLLSPLINANSAFAALALAEGKNDLEKWQVTSLKISAGTASGLTACYNSSIQIRLYELDFPRQGPAGLESGKELQESSALYEAANSR